MKKKVLLRCLLGAPVGLAVSTLITVVISLTVGDGRYYPVVPELVNDCGSEINAMLLQTACSLLYGVAWAGASLVWEKESWSLLRQTVTHLVVCSAATFPIAYFMRWMAHDVYGVLVYFGIFVAVYLAIWISQYFATKKRVRQLNQKVREGNLSGR